MASSITEEDISKLREARYLTAEILHRLPAQGQVIPSPRSNEKVMFISHFLRGVAHGGVEFLEGSLLGIREFTIFRMKQEPE